MPNLTHSKITRILIADDQPLIRRGLDDLFAEYADLRVVGSVGNCREIVPVARQLQPDVVLSDVRIDGEPAFDAIRQLTRRSNRTNVLVFSLHSETSTVFHAIRNGALGFILKTCNSGNLIDAVRAVGQGRRFFSPEANSPAVMRRLKELEPREEAQPIIAPRSLTNREQEVLELVTQGLTSKEIATRLGIGRRTVESHSGNLLAKLGVRNKAQLVKRAITERMVRV